MYKLRVTFTGLALLVDHRRCLSERIMGTILGMDAKEVGCLPTVESAPVFTFSHRVRIYADDAWFLCVVAFSLLWIFHFRLRELSAARTYLPQSRDRATNATCRSSFAGFCSWLPGNELSVIECHIANSRPDRCH